MYKKIENICIKENVKLAKLGLREHSFVNVSIRANDDRFFIKPSGVKVNKLKKGQCLLIDIKTGKVVNRSALKPSVDTPTHLEIYKNFKNIKSISHCHSMYATAWAQASRSIPLLGTTHADFWEKDLFHCHTPYYTLRPLHLICYWCNLLNSAMGGSFIHSLSQERANCFCNVTPFCPPDQGAVSFH